MGNWATSCFCQESIEKEISYLGGTFLFRGIESYSKIKHLVACYNIKAESENAAVVSL